MNNVIISDFATTLNTLKLKYRRELFLALGLVVIFLLLGWYGFVMDDIRLVILSMVTVIAMIVSTILGYKKYHGIKPDLTFGETPVTEMKSRVNFLKYILKTEKIYGFIAACSLCVYSLYIFFDELYNSIVLSIISAVALVGLIFLVVKMQQNWISKLEDTIKQLEDSVIQIETDK